MRISVWGLRFPFISYPGDAGAALLTVHDVGGSEVWVLGLHSVCTGEEALHVLREVPAFVLIKYRKQDDVSLV